MQLHEPKIRLTGRDGNGVRWSVTVFPESWEDFCALHRAEHDLDLEDWSADWEYDPPDPEHYMPCWPEDERSGWCMYQTVGEGSPLSPVFPDPEGLVAWLVDSEGYSWPAAARFVKDGWAPMFMMSPSEGWAADGIAANDFLGRGL